MTAAATAGEFLRLIGERDAGRARRRHRPARRGRPRRRPGAPRARRRRARDLPHRARRAARPAVRLRRRRRRLPHEAVRVRRARRAPARADPPWRQRPRASRPAACGSTRRRTRASCGERAIDLTPTEFRILARLAGAPGDAVRRRELVQAAWPHGAIVHDNTLDVYIARIRRKLASLPERARRSRRCTAWATRCDDAAAARRPHAAAGRHRRRGRPRARRRGRGVLRPARAAALRQRDSLAKGRAAAELSSLEHPQRQARRARGRQRGRSRARSGCSPAPRARGPRAPAEVDRAARSLAGGPRARSTSASRRACTRCRSCEDGVRYGTVVSAISLDPYEETGRTALIGSLAARRAPARRDHAALALDARPRVPAGLAHGRGRRELERARPRPPLRPRRALRRAHPARLDARRAAGADRREPAPRAALHRRAVARAAHAARAGEGRTELALRRERTPEEYREALEAVDRNIDQMTRTVETLVAAARQEAGLAMTTSDARDAVGSPSATSARPAPRSSCG